MNVDATRAMNELLIRKIERFACDLFTVVLLDGRMGSGETVGEAYEKALSPGGFNIETMQVAA